MKLSIPFLCITTFLSFSFSCTTAPISSDIDLEKNTASIPILNYDSLNNKSKNPYAITLHTVSDDKNLHTLIIAIDLFNGAHFISPNAKRDFKGKFTILLEPNPYYELSDHLKEFPLSIEEHDPHPFTNGVVNWVRQNTVYSQKFNINSQDSFEIKGLIQFTIEPRCSLEKVPFLIKVTDGMVTAQLTGC